MAKQTDERKRKLQVIRGYGASFNYRHGTDSGTVGRSQRPITLPRMPWDEEKADTEQNKP